MIAYQDRRSRLGRALSRQSAGRAKALMQEFPAAARTEKTASTP